MFVSSSCYHRDLCWNLFECILIEFHLHASALVSVFLDEVLSKPQLVQLITYSFISIIYFDKMGSQEIPNQDDYKLKDTITKLGDDDHMEVCMVEKPW